MKSSDLEGMLPTSISRRHLLRLGAAAVPLTALLAACGSDEGSVSSGANTRSGDGSSTTSSSRSLTPTPACGDDDEPTPTITEGPFFESGSPERTSIRDGDGAPLVITGTVLSTECVALAGAKLDFWQANNDGQYDNSGYEFRGHQFTDDQGRFSLETIVPPPYAQRTSHIHVKVQPSGGSVLTTQLYFPGVAKNDSDDLFDAACLMDVSTVSDGQAATFTFVVAA